MHIIDRRRDAQTACGLDRHAWARTPGCREASTDSGHLVDCPRCLGHVGLDALIAAECALAHAAAFAGIPAFDDNAQVAILRGVLLTALRDVRHALGAAGEPPRTSAMEHIP